ncbi:hypothetical protein H7347_00150 [Corynebacterium sp. zg-331]|uniref:hypothetical protein n=1 Tax=unclassified Corynebacterium TaxID=2624378 RepID=UPI00128AF62E|nr:MULTISPECIES: hypothetical protein [unclassified Corynebacterium]MBC3185009.1 hypothetical protein [Corynebacterium sp. zg-331]MPV51509.1 hypothetical protein [Corynebacterium sp. zg331]
MITLAPTSNIAKAETSETVKETVWVEESMKALENISDEDLQFITKVTSLGEHYRGKENGKLTIDLTDEEIESEHGFSNEELRQLHGIMNLNQETLNQKKSDQRFISPYDHRIGHIPHKDLTVGAAATLVTAAEAGPAALEAAFIAWNSLQGGPIGTAITGAIVVLGTGFFIDLAAKLTTAVASGRGLTFYGHAGSPPLKVEVEEE